MDWKLHPIMYAIMVLCFFDFQVDCLIQDHSHGKNSMVIMVLCFRPRMIATLENMKIRYFLFIFCMCRWVFCSCRWEWECFYPDILLQRNLNCKILSELGAISIMMVPYFLLNLWNIISPFCFSEYEQLFHILECLSINKLNCQALS